MSKDIWIAEHERLYAEYLDAHPEASEQEALDHADDNTSEAVAERLADKIDRARDRMKYEDMK